ncbi:ImmA/IrrE family metallo-endopeptidase [Enterococcus sp.]|uniref:ImmA/IrrE family metallo-endopeptidase n=1 Tax=Enterococcus sp. TaxID=35783 RepID=UPI003C76B100
MQQDEKLMSAFPHLTYLYDPIMPDKQKGWICDDVVYLNPRQTKTELTCTIAEEIGHYLTSVGDIVDQNTNEKQKQERKARDAGSLLLVTPFDIIDCFDNGCREIWECAEYLSVTEETFKTAVKWYARKYDGVITEDKHTIWFHKDGTMSVYKSLI